jgi:hypothetical protein
MDRKTRFTRWLFSMVILAVAECAGVVAVEFALTVPALAQRSDDRFPFLSRQRQPRGGGFFQQLFGPSKPQPQEIEQAPADYSRAPSPRKPDPKAEPVEPTTTIVVMGDGMADWLAYGLEDAFSDMPEVGIVRKSKVHSGLLRYDPKNDLDWWHAARDILAQEKPNYVIMMLGVSDRQNIREKDLAKEAEKNNAKDSSNKDQQDKDKADKSAQNKDDDPVQPAIIAPEPQQKKKTNGIVEFRSDQWEKIYSRRIDETVAALKSKGVPVFWVGLPSIRGTRSTADAVYLNDLYRARAERAGAIYVDVWDGFIDEAGKYTSYGPDYEGQVRRLRSGDGVYFTKYGARKLSHYAERELRRYMSNRGPVALPSGPMGPVPANEKSTVRPLIGPVVPLTITTGNSDELAGGSGAVSARRDATATGVLVKGDAVTAPPGRADDFVWPRGSVAATVSPVAAAPAAAATASASAAAASAAVPANVVAKPEPVTEIKQKPTEPKNRPTAKTATQNSVVNPKPRPEQNAAPRPPQPVRPSSGGLFGANGPFGWMR